VKRLAWFIGVVVLLAGSWVAVSGGHPMRVLIGSVSGTDALAYAPPRREIDVAAGPPQPTLSLAEAGVDPAAVEEAMRYAETRNSTALVIGVNGHVVYQKFWGKFWGKSGGDTALDSQVDLSGFTPVLAALVLGTAQQNGEIRDLDTPLSTWLPEWSKDPRGTITLRDLLTGNSNLAKPGARAWPRSLAASYYAGGDLGATLLRWPQAERPDPSGSPAGVDADLLSIVLSRAFKSDYASLVKERLWQPLEAGGFSVGIDDAAHVRAGCCLRARLGDWMRMGALIANHGVFEGNQLSPPDFARLMVTPTHKGSARAVFMRVGGQFAAHDVVWLEAAGKQRMWMVPSLKLVILRTGGEPAATQGWDEAMIPDSIIRGTRGWEPSSAGAGEKVDPNLYAPHH
jgi:CubicO group peptidase (beta-lactamase class C family)